MGVSTLQDLFGRIVPPVAGAVEGLSLDALTARVDPDANTLAWLAWHVAREQDVQVAGAVGRPQVWTAQGWARRFDLPFDDAAMGYGHSSDDVAAVRVPADLLVGYLRAVEAESVDVLASLDDAALDEVVDERWDPPVTLGVRLVSVAADALQHAGQAAYLRGVLERTGRA